MAYSDDEGQTITWNVTNYYFVDDEEEPICFSVLPIQWRGRQRPETMKQKIFLHGIADSGLQKIYKQVIAWKFELSYSQPEISVLSKENIWIKLLKPRKSFEGTIRTILITVHYLRFLKKNPQTSGKSLWDHLRKVFSSYGVKPSESDLMDHLPLIRAAVKQDRKLAKSKFLLTFLENPRKRKTLSEDICTSFCGKKPKFIVPDGSEDSDEELGDADKDDSDENTDPFDTACSICDNGGDLLVCEGRCFRSFHATVDAGADSDCKSLRLSKAAVEAIKKFLCLNCQYKQHQCFACGKLGSSDNSSGAEVFCCVSATCGYFYHPKCAAELLHPGNEVKVKRLQNKIAAGESFTCPIHKCLVCKQGENKEDKDLQFALCRRCPRAYHRKCLPRKIAFEDSKAEGIIQRAWDDLLPNRILIYCLKHKIERNISTPSRNHIIFPDVEKLKKTSVLQSIHGELVTKSNVISENFPKHIAEITSKQVQKCASKNLSLKVASKKPLKNNIKSSTMNVNKSCPADAQNVPLRKEVLNPVLEGSTIAMSKKQQNLPARKIKTTITHVPSIKKSSSSQPLLDAEAEKRVLAIMKEKAASVILEDIKRNHRVPSKNAFTNNVVDKAMQGKMDGSCEVVRADLQNLEKGSIEEELKTVCESESLNQIIQWKVVDKLHCYVQNGDTIVDICCGTNDFACLMKLKLEETGKTCSFKNYLVKNNLNFENRDWMRVDRRELPTGSQLIMVLNPFLEVEASAADKFIIKALEFKPKLLILIVLDETERLDESELAYDLVWEDNEKLSNESYVDMTDEQMKQWNLKPALLYLWSRPDWTAKHKNIALRQGHISKKHKDSHLEENHKETEASLDNKTDGTSLLEASPSKARYTSSEERDREEDLGQLQFVCAGSGLKEPSQGHVKDNVDSSEEHEQYRREADGKSQTKDNGSQGLDSSTHQCLSMFEDPMPINTSIPMGFAPKLQRPLSDQYKSGGWLDE